MDAMTDLLRNRRPPAALMDVYAGEDAGRSRNAPCTCGSGTKWKHCHGAAHLDAQSDIGDGRP